MIMLGKAPQPVMLAPKSIYTNIDHYQMDEGPNKAKKDAQPQIFNAQSCTCGNKRVFPNQPDHPSVMNSSGLCGCLVVPGGGCN